MTWQDHPKAPKADARFCELTAIENDSIREFVFGEGKDAFRMFIYRNGSMVRAYMNKCPHFHISLNKPDGSLMLYNDTIWCAHHSAVFRVEDGFCIDGPCKSGTLEVIPLRLESGVIYAG